MKPAYKWTVIFIVAAIIAVAAYDVWAISAHGIESSISHTIILWAYEYPIFPFIFGFVMGHLFWRMRDTPETEAVTKFIDSKKENSP